MAFRAQFSENTIGPACQSCREQLIAGNFSGLQARSFDRFSGSPQRQILERLQHLALRPRLWGSYLRKMLFAGNRRRLLTRWKHQEQAGTQPADATAQQIAYPRSLEFELSTVCNLECVMCFGEFSSSIRKNREQLPPLPEVYDHPDFLTQVSPFIRSAMEAKFYGGEPFLIPLYFELWERFIETNPGALLSITTNATVYNKRVQRVLENLNVHLVISIDSFEPTTYESIRKNARYDRVMQNLKTMDHLVRQRGQHLTLSICPMQINWREMPGIFTKANQHQWFIHVNTVWFPMEQSLRFLPARKLQEITNYLSEQAPANWQGPMGHNNQEAYRGLIKQVAAWAVQSADQPITPINS
jgi:sulfatase maturation enzyme AslB (radical SAM superfamily)